ncbi:MAG: TatD family deoxyribonuclease [Desulfobacteraceae bacterium]|nr:MAG: TatD family deoxyribonuclease [Desulfobacteraceae bacterium]
MSHNTGLTRQSVPVSKEVFVFIDSHCHLHDHRVIRKVPGIVARAHREGVTHMMSCATMEDNFEDTLELSRRFKGIVPFLGIHPWFIRARSNGWEQVLGTYLDHYPAGIGETGLDFMDRGADREDQMHVFEVHLALARELARPINVHVRKAWDAFIHLIKRMGPLPAGGLIHSYSGSADMTALFKKYNWHISFSGSLTRPNAKKTTRALACIDSDQLLLETDAPDIFPTLPDRDMSGLNFPENLPAIARIASRIRDEDENEFYEQVYENSMMLFSPLIDAPGQEAGPLDARDG